MSRRSVCVSTVRTQKQERKCHIFPPFATRRSALPINAFVAERQNIGYPHLFTGAEPSLRKHPAMAAVNNCAGAQVPHRIRMDFRIQSRYPLPRFSRLGGLGLRTTSRFDDFELYRPARRAGLDPLTTTQEGVAVNSERLFYIAVARSSLREGRKLLTSTPMPHAHKPSL